MPNLREKFKIVITDLKMDKKQKIIARLYGDITNNL